ncbi:MAG TPA: hypothetical protein VG722_11350, partial [Tepidisphaeraceae bacterium]|nr:hypothetical protein [Tepidisphaeraceae bacterium]
LALAAINRLEDRPEYKTNIRSIEDLSGYLGTIENGQTFGALIGDRGVGTFGGSQDHTAILCCQPGRLSQYGFCPVRSEGTIAFPEGYVLAVGVSGVVAEKTGKARELYNRASLAAFEALRVWNTVACRSDPTLAAAARSSPTAPEQIRTVLSDSISPDYPAKLLRNRFEQFFDESEQIIPQTAAALAAGDLAAIGQLIDRSQKNAEQLLGNQVRETIFLASSARSQGAVAASAFGAGFGGSVWALVKANQATQFLRAWSKSYHDHLSAVASGSSFFVTRPSISAAEL